MTWQPDEYILGALHDAVHRGDPDAYLAALVDSCLVVPGDPAGGGWPVVETPDGVCVVAYTMLEALPPGIDGYAIWPAFDLLHGWPDPEWSLSVDSGLPTHVTVEPSGIAEAAARAADMYPLDVALWAAGGDPRSYLDAVVGAEVVVPMRPDGSPSRDLTDPEFAWWRAPDPPAIALFTSPVRLRARLGEVPWLVTGFIDLLRHWPDGHAALMDPDHHIGATLPAEAMAAMASTVPNPPLQTP
ncbi:hypothetical protein K1W54_36920 [Micromonospora sp. CPCC 205371]|nr:hypothetical protein [Micromonospora sp. CPCC 205371]